MQVCRRVGTITVWLLRDFAPESADTSVRFLYAQELPWEQVLSTVEPSLS